MNMQIITTRARDFVRAYLNPNATSYDEFIKALSDAYKSGKITDDGLKSLSDESSTKSFNEIYLGKPAADPSPDIRVKKASERYTTTKSMALHTKTGQPVTYQGSVVEHPSQRELARIGAFFKSWVCNQPARLGELGIARPRMNEHERELVKELAHEGQWVSHREDAETTAKSFQAWGLNAKALYDESGGSQGLEIVPIEFDTAIVTQMMLYGELLPFVDIREVTSRRIEGAGVGHPTVTWQAQEQTATTTLFNTAAMVSAFDTNVYVATCALEYGFDFASDSPVNIGALLVRLCSEAIAASVDNMIATGSGAGQPTGLINTAGATVLAPSGGAGAVPTINDAEALFFGIPKAYRSRRTALNVAYVGNDVNFRRLRSTPVGAADARRLFGQNYDDYSAVLGVPYKVANAMPNTKIVAVPLSYYRLYRRVGLDMQLLQREGKTLALDNKNLLILRSRIGGQMTRADVLEVLDNLAA